MRVFLIILDGFGIGPAPDWAFFNPLPGATLPRIIEQLHGINIPHLQQLGLANLVSLRGIPPSEVPLGAFGAVVPKTQGCDTYAGLMEMMGVIRPQRYATFDHGIPLPALKEIQRLVNVSFIGNRNASGADMLQQYGQDHIKTRNPIIYSAGDGVVLIIAHEDIIEPQELYEIGRKAISVLGNYDIARVIVRPFYGEFPYFKRRHELRKYFVAQSSSSNRSLVDILIETQDVSLFATEHMASLLGDGFCCKATVFENIKGNRHQFEHILRLINTIDHQKSLAFFCFQEFDESCHTQDIQRFNLLLLELDSFLGQIIQLSSPEDIFIITADHGNDPTIKKVGHTRELSPLLVFGKKLRDGIALGVRSTLADIGATIAEILEVGALSSGTSFLSLIQQSDDTL